MHVMPEKTGNWKRFLSGQVDRCSLAYYNKSTKVNYGGTHHAAMSERMDCPAEPVGQSAADAHAAGRGLEAARRMVGQHQ